MSQPDKCNCDVIHRNSYHACPHSLAYPFVDEDYVDGIMVPVECYVKGDTCIFLKFKELVKSNRELTKKLDIITEENKSLAADLFTVKLKEAVETTSSLLDGLDMDGN